MIVMTFYNLNSYGNGLPHGLTPGYDRTTFTKLQIRIRRTGMAHACMTEGKIIFHGVRCVQTTQTPGDLLGHRPAGARPLRQAQPSSHTGDVGI